MTDGRKLRSKDAAPETAGLFDFDHMNGFVHMDHRIGVRKRSDNKGKPYKFFNIETPQLTKNSAKVTRLASSGVPRKSKFRDDPLDDAVYEVFHKKMRKQEVTMVKTDSMRILLEVDNLQAQLRQLNADSWMRYLHSICKIEDMKDLDEMKAKKELTVLEINRLLRKFASWKKRQEDLDNSIKHFSHAYDNPEGGKEYDMSLDELKERRRQQRIAKYGPILRIRLHNGYVLVCDPVCPPRLVKDAQTPAPKRNSRTPSPKSSVSKSAEVDTTNPKLIISLRYAGRKSDSSSSTDPDSPLSVIDDVPERTLDSFVDNLFSDVPRDYENSTKNARSTRLKTARQKSMIQSQLHF